MKLAVEWLPRCRYPELLAHVEAALSAKRTVLFLTECWPCITQGFQSIEADFLEVPQVPVYRALRGGRATAHEPGQLLLFPVVPLSSEHTFETWLDFFLGCQASLLCSYGLEPQIESGEQPGIWCGGAKVAFAGLSLRGRWLHHGFSLNIVNDLSTFAKIRPCGRFLPVTTLQAQLKVPREAAKLWQESCQKLAQLCTEGGVDVG